MRPLVRWLAVAALVALCTRPLGVAAQPSSTPARVTPVVSEPHPEINAAIRALERAKGHLQRAAHDFGGHRVEAIQSIDAALVQLRFALQYDKK
jgi:hypothetical protein